MSVLAYTTSGVEDSSNFDLVRIETRNEQGEFFDEWARRAEPYFAKLGDLVRCQKYLIGRVPLPIYSVKKEDGTILKVTENCLSEWRSNYIPPSKTRWR